jgi:UDP-N-acetylmuramoyl-tripeptide--D-alanyl-D-alanine ligase
MKFVFKTILKYYLKYLTKLFLFIYRPTIIAIAGSTNKTFVKDEIVKVLKEKGIRAMSNPKNFNTEIGLPLAILNLESGYHSYKKWLPVIIKAPFNILRRKFPRVLVLELGVSEPGDMKYLLSIIKPKIAVITDITQRYLDAFGDMDELVGEYEYLARNIKKKGLVILNYDNLRVRNMAKITKGKIETFGLSDGADWRVVEINKSDNGQNVKVAREGKIVRHEIKKFGEHHVYSLLAGLIVKHYVEEKKKI